MLNFVTFYADTADTAGVAEGPSSPASGFFRHTDVRYTDLLQLMRRSAALFHPDAEFTLLTTENSTVEWSSSRQTDLPVPAERLMLDRALAQRRYLDGHNFHRPVIILDTDILINGDLSPLLNDDFDVALTWRKNPTMPINAGVKVVNNRRPQQVRHFFSRLFEHYQSKFADQAAWWGEQLAVCDLLRMDTESLPDPQGFEGVRIRYLPCETFNFSPGNEREAIASAIEGKPVLHFKGPRKWLMPLYWTAHLEPLETRLAESLAI